MACDHAPVVLGWRVVPAVRAYSIIWGWRACRLATSSLHCWAKLTASSGVAGDRSAAAVGKRGYEAAAAAAAVCPSAWASTGRRVSEDRGSVDSEALVGVSRASGSRVASWLEGGAVSYTHLTLPTICSV